MCRAGAHVPVPNARKFSRAWQLTRPWLRYDPVCVLMWCEACRAHPQLGSSVPFVQGTSNFKLFSVKEHENSGTHNVSVALWWSGGRVTSVIRTLPGNLQEGIMALFHCPVSGVHAMPHCVASGELGINSTHPELQQK